MLLLFLSRRFFFKRAFPGGSKKRPPEPSPSSCFFLKSEILPAFLVSRDDRYSGHPSEMPTTSVSWCHWMKKGRELLLLRVWFSSFNTLFMLAQMAFVITALALISLLQNLAQEELFVNLSSSSFKYWLLSLLFVVRVSFERHSSYSKVSFSIAFTIILHLVIIILFLFFSDSFDWKGDQPLSLISNHNRRLLRVKRPTTP